MGISGTLKGCATAATGFAVTCTKGGVHIVSGLAKGAAKTAKKGTLGVVHTARTGTLGAVAFGSNLTRSSICTVGAVAGVATAFYSAEVCKDLWAYARGSEISFSDKYFKHYDLSKLKEFDASCLKDKNNVILGVGVVALCILGYKISNGIRIWAESKITPESLENRLRRLEGEDGILNQAINDNEQTAIDTSQALEKRLVALEKANPVQIASDLNRHKKACAKQKKNLSASVGDATKQFGKVVGSYNKEFGKLSESNKEFKEDVSKKLEEMAQTLAGLDASVNASDSQFQQGYKRLEDMVNQFNERQKKYSDDKAQEMFLQVQSVSNDLQTLSASLKEGQTKVDEAIAKILERIVKLETTKKDANG